MELPELPEFLQKMLGVQRKPRKVIRSIALKPEWEALLKRQEELLQERRDIEKKANDDLVVIAKKLHAISREFWYHVEHDTEVLDDMRINSTTRMIEVLADEDA